MKTKHYLLNSIIVLMSLLFFTACEKKDASSTYALNIKVSPEESGVIGGNCEGDYNEGTGLWLNATDNNLGYSFINWTIGSDIISTSLDLYYTMPSYNVTIVANFKDHRGNGVIDIEGNEYASVIIGEQEWMAENLKTTKYNDGTAIPLVTDDNAWRNLSPPAYCWYDNNQAANSNKYGAIYNWYAVETGKLCPTGWHVPTDAEWTILTDYLGGEDFAGTKLKSKTVWKSSYNNTDDYGFSALPGGFRFSYDGSFRGVWIFSRWWCSTQMPGSPCWYRIMSNDKEDVGRYTDGGGNGAYVRCLRD